MRVYAMPMATGRIEPDDDERERSAPVDDLPRDRREDQDRQAEHREGQPDEREIGPESLEEQAPDDLVRAAREVAPGVDDDHRDEPAVPEARRRRRAGGSRAIGIDVGRGPAGERRRVGRELGRVGRRAPGASGPASRGRAARWPGRTSTAATALKTNTKAMPPKFAAPMAAIAGPSSRPPIWAAPYSPNASPRLPSAASRRSGSRARPGRRARRSARPGRAAPGTPAAR